METLNFRGRKNTTFKEKVFTIKINTTPIDLTDYEITGQLKSKYDNAPALDLPIVIHDPTNGKFKIEAFKPTVSGNFLYDIKLKGADGVVERWIMGEFLIDNSVTNGN